MVAGPGVYDHECTFTREATDADAVVLIVIGGKNGSGFSVQARADRPLPDLAGLLRRVADTLDRDT